MARISAQAAARCSDWVSGDEESGAELPAVAFAQWIGSSAERALIVHVDSGAASLVTASLEGAEGRLTDVIECDARDSGQTYDHECRTDLTNVPPQAATLGAERIRTGGARRPGKAAPRPSATRLTRWPFAVLEGAVLLLAALTFYCSSPAARFLVVQAETAGLKLAAGGQPMSAWHLSDVTVCLWRKDNFQRTGSAPRDCAGKQFAIIALGSLDFSWPSGTGHIFRG